MNQKDNNNKNIKKPASPKVITKSKYFKIGIRDSARVRIIKEGMNHLFDLRNRELEDAFYHEAGQYTERIIGETRRMNITEDDDEEIMAKVFSRTENGERRAIEDDARDQEGAGLEDEELEDEELEEEELEEDLEEDLEEEPELEEESETLDSEEVLALQERIQAEDQEEYERIRAELEEEEDEANNDN